MVDFIEALRVWVEESILKRLQMHFFSVMADECTDIMTVEELSVDVFCCWEENGIPMECFLEIVPLTKADAESFYTCSNCHIPQRQVGIIVGMGFDGASFFLARRLVFKQESRNMLYMQYLSTATVTCCN